MDLEGLKATIGPLLPMAEAMIPPQIPVNDVSKFIDGHLKLFISESNPLYVLLYKIAISTSEQDPETMELRLMALRDALNAWRPPSL